MIRATAAIALAITLASCGQKGPLRLDPPKQPAPQAAPVPAPPPAPAPPVPTAPATPEPENKS